MRRNIHMNKAKRHILFGIFSVLALFLGISFFLWTAVPYGQMAVFYRNLKKEVNGDAAPLLASRASFEPFTVIQPELRYQFIEYIFGQYLADPNGQNPQMLALAIQKLEEVISRGTNYP